MGAWSWVNVVGIGLQVVGLAVAFLGLRQLHHDLTGTHLLSRLLAALPFWRRKPVTVYGQGTTSAAVAGEGHATVLPGPMPAELSDAQRIDWLEERLRQLWENHNHLSAGTHSRFRQVRSDIKKAERTATSKAEDVAAQVRELRSAVAGGVDGKGLREAAVGLLVTAIGLVLTLVAAIQIST